MQLTNFRARHRAAISVVSRFLAIDDWSDELIAPADLVRDARAVIEAEPLAGAAQPLVQGAELRGLVYHPEGSAERLTWKAASEYIEALNKQAYGGRTGWRLPTLPELEAPRCLDVCNPAVDKSKWPQIKPEFYWSSSVCVFNRDYQWGVHFYGGGTGVAHRDDGTGFVLAVCDGLPASPGQ